MTGPADDPSEQTPQDASAGRDDGARPCDDAVAELYRYLDGELSEEERRGIEDHLRECSPCLEAFDFEAELKRVVAAGAHQPCPEELKARIAALLSEPPESA